MSLSVRPQASFPVIDGKVLEVVHYAGVAPDSPTLVFLHEGLGSVGQWHDFPQRLSHATGCAALVYSRAGYGQSDPVALPRPNRYLHHEGLVVLPDLLRHLGIGHHILIGHSDGGSIALISAGGAPQPGLLGVITEAAHVFNEQISYDSVQQTRVAYETTDLRNKLARYHKDVDNAFLGWNDVWLSADFWNWNLEEYLPRIRVPLLVMQGEQDQ
ncbi:alpha/beta hydrolase [Deinococcus sp.]|uniref:alpha/beta fold hydrolase n=1 Tax=Deinococcus sp. TaxID=47478 RepID=UPI0025B867DB|nr:alpha/beta hydrolase [Deinococcus sp.]